MLITLIKAVISSLLSNRKFYVDKYNEERAFYKGSKLADETDIPTPDWLWLERALYELEPPASPEDWDPQPEALDADAVRTVHPTAHTGWSLLGQKCIAGAKGRACPQTTSSTHRFY